MLCAGVNPIKIIDKKRQRYKTKEKNIANKVCDKK